MRKMYNQTGSVYLVTIWQYTMYMEHDIIVAPYIVIKASYK